MGLQIALQKLKVDGGQCFFKVGNYETHYEVLCISNKMYV